MVDILTAAAQIGSLILVAALGVITLKESTRD